MIKLHVTVSPHKKILSLPSDFITLSGVTQLIREKFSSLPTEILLQYWFEEEDFCEWVDLDEDTIKTFEEKKIHKLKVVAVDEPGVSSSSSSPRGPAKQQPQVDDDVQHIASTSQSSLTVPAVRSGSTQSG